MLVLSRKAGERILIGDSIVVTILGGRQSQVRIGIEAPPDVVVLRSELTPVAAGPRLNFASETRQTLSSVAG